jgi:hypothetical protein
MPSYIFPTQVICKKNDNVWCDMLLSTKSNHADRKSDGQQSNDHPAKKRANHAGTSIAQINRLDAQA